MGRPVAVTKALTAASATAIATAQAVAAAGFVTIDGSAASGGVATLDTQRRVLWTSSGDDHLLTLKIVGTREGGGSINETLTGTNGSTVATNLDFLTITSAYLSGAAAGTVSLGTNTVGSSRWIRADPHLTPFYISLAVALVSGSGNVSVEETYDEFLALAGPHSTPGYQGATTIPTPILDPMLQGLTAAAQGAIDFPVAGWRLTINSGTGSWKCTGTQAGLAGP